MRVSGGRVRVCVCACRAVAVAVAELLLVAVLLRGEGKPQVPRARVACLLMLHRALEDVARKVSADRRDAADSAAAKRKRKRKDAKPAIKSVSAFLMGILRDQKRGVPAPAYKDKQQQSQRRTWVRGRTRLALGRASR